MPDPFKRFFNKPDKEISLDVDKFSTYHIQLVNGEFEVLSSHFQRSQSVFSVLDDLFRTLGPFEKQAVANMIKHRDVQLTIKKIPSPRHQQQQVKDSTEIDDIIILLQRHLGREELSFKQLQQLLENQATHISEAVHSGYGLDYYSEENYRQRMMDLVSFLLRASRVAKELSEYNT